MSTKLLYMEHMQELEADAQVVRTDQRDGKHIIYLDQTVFYPQGGGQPYDTGVIENEHARFVVTEVRFIDGEVLHIGHYENGSLVVGDDVTCRVDNERRE